MLGSKVQFHDDEGFEERPRRASHLETQTGAFGTTSDLFGAEPATGPHSTMAILPHRFSVPRLALLLTIGIVIGVALFLAVSPTSNAPRKRAVVARQSVEPLKLSVSVGGESSNAPVVEHLPSLEQHIEGSPVSLAARRFLFADNTERAYGPEFVRGKFEDRTTENGAQLTRDDLRAAQGSKGRYSANGSVEWQGGFDTPIRALISI